MKKQVIKKFKRAISLMLLVAVLASSGILSSCATAKETTALTINNVPISNDVFVYFLDSAMAELGTEADKNAIYTKATYLADIYFKTNSLAKKVGISLSTASKAAVSEKVNAYWSIYARYYENIGVTKETLTKIFTADAYRGQLLIHYYGEGGEEEVGLGNMYAYFKMNYIVFQAINGYFTYLDDTGASVRLSENEIEELVLKFQNMASLINAKEKSMEEAADFLSSSNYSSSVVTLVLGKNDTTYPAGFFEKIQATKARMATVIGTDQYIFLVLRGDAGVTSPYFTEKKEEILTALVGERIDKKIEDSLQTNSKMNSSNCEGLYILIKESRVG